MLSRDDRPFSKETWIAFASLLGIAIYLITRFALHARFAEWALIACAGAIAQEVIDVLAVLNALRVSAVRRELNDLDGP